MNYFSYVIYNQEQHRFFYGFTEDVKRAVIAHNKGLIEFTKDAKNWVLLYEEGFETKKKAIWRSKFYKTVAGQRHLRKILNM